MRDPDFSGPRGRMWRVACPTEETLKAHPSWNATIGCWLLDVPSAHPVWRSYVLGVVSLRDIPGVPSAAKHYPGAEYEILLHALDPGKPMPDVEDAEKFRPAFLAPANLVEQFHGVSSEDAKRIAELLGRSFIDGANSPDTDFRLATQCSLRLTIEHFALGKAKEKDRG
jgi:hypothetical protein